MGPLELTLFILVPLITFAAGHRIGKAEGRLLGRDEVEGRRSNKTGG